MKTLFHTLACLLFASLLSVDAWSMGAAKPKSECALSPQQKTFASIIKKRVPRGSGGRAPAAAILLVNSSGDPIDVGYEKNSTNFQAVASTQKILSAWVLVNHASLSESVTFNYQDLEYDLEGNRAIRRSTGKRINVGESAKLSEYLYTMITQSSNGASHAMTRNSDTQTTKEFVRLMNEEAKDILGASSKSYFQNPSGLTDDSSNQRFAASNKKQGSTARELAALAGKFMSKSKYRSALQKSGVAGASDGTLYKLGFTQAAGRTLVATFKHPKSGCQSNTIAFALFGESSASQENRFRAAFDEIYAAALK